MSKARASLAPSTVMRLARENPRPARLNASTTTVVVALVTVAACGAFGWRSIRGRSPHLHPLLASRSAALAGRSIPPAADAAIPASGANVDDLGGWAKADPASALAAALRLPPERQGPALFAVVAGAVGNPDDAVAAAKALLARDPVNGGAFGTMLMAALAKAGAFPAALELVRAAPADAQDYWAQSVFRIWGERDPETAAPAIAAMAEPLRRPAMDSLVAGWAERDPAALAAYAETMAGGPMRDDALSAALFKWVERDPDALAEWLRSLPPGRDLDAGAVVLVTSTDGANRTPEVAKRWAEVIRDPELSAEAVAVTGATAGRADN